MTSANYWFLTICGAEKVGFNQSLYLLGGAAAKFRKKDKDKKKKKKKQL